MRPLVITGPSANSGKTELACRLLHLAPNTQTLKITRFHREEHCPVHTVNEPACDGCDDTPAGFEIIEDDARIKVAGKDTGRLAQAGGLPVKWLRAAPHAFSYGLKAALDRFDLSKPLLIEGNSAATQPWLDATIVLIWPQQPRGIKASVLPALRRVDRLVLTEAPQRRIPPTLINACKRANVSIDDLPIPSWLSEDWWKGGQGRAPDETILSKILEDWIGLEFTNRYT